MHPCRNYANGRRAHGTVARRSRFPVLLCAVAVGLAGVAASARAQNFGDLVLGFAAASGTGANTNIEVDLGSVNAFSSSSVAAGTYTLADLNSDLSSAYGSSWASDPALTFAIVGVNSVNATPTYGTYDSSYAKSTVWAGAAESAPGTAATPYVGSVAASQTGGISNVSGVLGLSAATEGFALGTNLPDLTGHSSGLGTSLDAISISASALGAWTQAGGNTNFNLGKVTQGEFQQEVSTSGSAVEVFDIAPTANAPATDIQSADGNSSYFTLDGNGDLTFTVSSPGGNPGPGNGPGSAAILTNISTRSAVEAGADVQIAGFVITGTAPKQVLIRASGPSLAAFSVSGTLPDPTLTLFSGQTSIASNTNWNTSANAAAIASTASAVGAFAWTAGSADSAILATLQPGSYTAQVSGASGDSGVALVEVYDCDPSGGSELKNISTRSKVETGGSIQIAGFVVSGTQPRSVLIRACGPVLSGFGVSGVLPDPTLTLLSGQTVIATNTGWGSAANASSISATTSSLQTFPLAAGSADSAILMTLQPGKYTAQVSGASGDTGVALVEVYDAGTN
jgi:hypothetical protein